MKTFKRRFGEAYMLFKIRAGRGSVFTSELEGVLNAFTKGGVIILLIDKYFHYLVPVWILPVAWATQKIFEYLAGYYDEKELGWWRFSSEYEQRNINPWNQEVMEKLNDMQTQLQELKKKNYVIDVSQTKG